MLWLHPLLRLFTAVAVVATIFSAQSVTAVLAVYLAVFALALIAGVAESHVRFLGIVTLPLFLALLLVWAWAVEPARIPPGHESGGEYALFLWLRILACGGVLQFLILPLVQQPTHLRDFLERTGLRGAIGALILTSIIFLPEMEQRFARIVDARRAQGHSLAGAQGLRQLPALLMPLVSSLLDSATKRAELWSHRGLFERRASSDFQILYNRPLGVLVVAVALLAFVTATVS